MDATNIALVDLVVASHRLAKGFARAAIKLPANEQGRHANEIAFFMRSLETTLQPLALTMPTMEGQRYDPGLPVTAINLDEFEAGDSLFIEQVVEPVIMGPDGVVRMGTVLLKKIA